MEEDKTSVETEMEVDDEENDFPTPIGIIDNKFHLIQKIGEGSTSSVYLGHCPFDKTHTLYSFKVVNPDKNDKTLFEREVQMLSLIDHENVMKVYHSGTGKLMKQNGEIHERYYIMLEYLEHGELLDYIYLNGGFGEEYGRLIMNDLLNGLEACHDSGIVHRDIKGENIMLDKDYKIKLVDFGFATMKTQGKLKSYLGTLNYAAPELHLHQPYYGVSNDLFSLGVTIYVIITGSLPFKYPVINDPLYRYIFKNDYDTFWSKKNFKLSDSFKELFNNMISVNYTQRPSIAEIRRSKWMSEMKKDLLPALKEEYIKREKLVKQKREEMLLKRKLINNNGNNNQPQKMPNVYKGSKFDYKELVSQMEKMTLLNNKNIKENNKDFLSKYAINTHTSNEIESLVLLKKMINESGYEYIEKPEEPLIQVKINGRDSLLNVFLKIFNNEYYIDFDLKDIKKEIFLRFYHNILLFHNN